MSNTTQGRGPLRGLKVLELETVGPVPWAGMVLADMGANVLRIDRPAAVTMGLKRDDRYQLTARGKRSVGIDLKAAEGRSDFLRLIEHADVLLEGLRPGVLERLGLGPDRCHAIQPRLVYARMTGWGQDGDLAQEAGHDINYLAISGALHAIGPAEHPVVPLNIVGDFGGGGMLLVAGVLAALLERNVSGKGQVVDAAMLDGTLALMAPIYGRWQGGEWRDGREQNPTDGGAPFYTVYATSDGKHMAVGAIEPQFYKSLLQGLGLDESMLPSQHDQGRWAEMRQKFGGIFATRTRDDWSAVFANTDACVTPVLSMSEIEHHSHVRSRGNLQQVDGVLHPAPAPRFSRTPGCIRSGPVVRGSASPTTVAEWCQED
ncbi:CaiB/BaiF CoA-transferase family protein [Acidovorax sp. MR-S7]|uniref:CaiB/BaiF CoA transferase family protein n=1 Tax=Acidovorax sp. MR-S7 TaxID=1268622 RepID=UPI0003D3D705|nr:CaiB/BaiF CoA-transferase family protein [Acidovorax sp. MR-S7]GAD24576.1 predicted acyl-CoA transferases/carnitine dehydratase [Acidovorax sp. MR-S7]